MSATKQYELVYIAAPEATEQQLAELHDLVVGIAAKFNGTVDRTEAWGRRRLAYTIGRHKEGIYVLEVISGGGDLVKELDRRLKVSDLVIRHLVVRVDEDQQVIERAKTIRTETSRRRRVARGLPPDRQPGEGPQSSEDGDDDRDGFEGQEA
jgi:small subunit ribosomal protein S6